MQIRSPLVSIVLIFILFIATLVVPIGGIIHSGGAGVAAAANTPTPTPAPSPATRNSSQNLTSIEVSAGDISQNNHSHCNLVMPPETMELLSINLRTS